MFDLIDPQHDAPAFAGINDILGSSPTAAAVYANPLFQAAVDFIRDRVPDAALQDPRGSVAGKGVNFPKRRIVIRALQFLAASFIRRGGGSIGGSDVTRTTGDVRSQSTRIGPVQETTTFHGPTTTTSRSTRQSFGDADYANWLEQEAFKLLVLLGVDPSDASADSGKPFVLLTDSTLETGDEYSIYDDPAQQQQPQKQAPTGDGVFPFISGDD